MNLRATSSPIGDQQRAAMKFTYGSGSKPLEGYTIKRGIGQGGFGEVYYAVSDAGKEVALKLLRRHLEVELRGVRQCLNLKHPNLLGLYDIRTDGLDDCWVVMEYVSGESLEQVIDRNPHGMPVDEAVYWLRGVAAGVAYLHERGIVHRDLKPGNLFCDEGIVKVGDYGLAKFVSCSRRSGQTESVGTVHYMAPEIANGRYGKEIDTYALGIILYEMLSGCVPFEGESVGEVLMKHLTAQPDLGALGPPFRAIVERALDKDPDRRFASVKEMAALLPAGPAQPFVGSEGAPRPAAAQNAASPFAAPHSAASASPQAEPTHAEFVTAEVVDESEPIARMVRGQLRGLADAWAGVNLPSAAKLVIVLVASLVLIKTMAFWLPPLFALALCYGVYWCVRAVVVYGRHKHAAGAPHIATRGAARPGERPQAARRPTAADPAAQATPRRRRSWHPTGTERPCAGPHQKLTELLGSMLLSTGIVLVMAVVMLVLRNEKMATAQFAWLATLGVLGTWVVLVPAKCWEGSEVDQAPRRFVMLVAGLLLGAAAFGLANFLLVDLNYDPSFATRWGLGHHIPGGVYAVDGTPKLPVYLAYFGCLLLIVPWWRQADPARRIRLSIWSVGVSLLAAWLINAFWSFPQPWGLMVAGIMAVAVQLSSPWQRRGSKQ